MLKYLKNICQLVLSSSKGWEDVSASLSDPEQLMKDGYIPLVGVAAASEFVRLLYRDSGGFLTVMELAIALFGTYFVSYYVARLILEYYLRPIINSEVNNVKLSTFTIYGLGMLAIIEFIENVMPTDLTLVKFLPLFVALVLYKGAKYMSVKPEKELAFLGLVVLAIIVVPIGIFSILKLIIV